MLYFPNFAITQFDNGVKWEKHNAPAL